MWPKTRIPWSSYEEREREKGRREGGQERGRKEGDWLQLRPTDYGFLGVIHMTYASRSRFLSPAGLGRRTAQDNPGLGVNPGSRRLFSKSRRARHPEHRWPGRPTYNQEAQQASGGTAVTGIRKHKFSSDTRVLFLLKKNLQLCIACCPKPAVTPCSYLLTAHTE